VGRPKGQLILTRASHRLRRRRDRTVATTTAQLLREFAEEAESELNALLSIGPEGNTCEQNVDA
jgi:hypothetical protein